MGFQTQNFRSKEFSMSPKQLILIGIFLIALCLALVLAPLIFDEVKMGEYHVKQAVSGEVTAITQTGYYMQNFGTVIKFPVSETFYFTKDAEGGHGDWSIHVTFNDGANCDIAGTCRVDMPRDSKEAVDLVVTRGYKSFDEIETKLILPLVRRSLMLTANLMSAKESYSDKRNDFITWAREQVEKGVYVTRDLRVEEIDAISGQKVHRTTKEIVRDDKGVALRDKNPLEGTGITLSQLEIKNFHYDERVTKQIQTQQEALMSVQTSRANAQRAEQDKLTTEAEGQAKVMKAKYEEEEKKARALVQAAQEKEVAVINAQKQVEVEQKAKEQALVQASKEKEVAVVSANRSLEVSTIELQASLKEKERQIALGQGEAERKKLVMEADGALQVKGEIFKAVMQSWAEAYAKRPVPNIYIAGGEEKNGNLDTQTGTFMQLMTVKAMKDLGLDMTLPSGRK
jgi:hypothetical protein